MAGEIKFQGTGALPFLLQEPLHFTGCSFPLAGDDVL
jgi:hypothetical protein